jgi:hypothetical protein
VLLLQSVAFSSALVMRLPDGGSLIPDGLFGIEYGQDRARKARRGIPNLLVLTLTREPGRLAAALRQD